MDSLVDALSTQAAPWWAVPLSMIVGVLLGVFAVRRGRVAPAAAGAAPADPQVRSIYVRFLAATDTAHNSIVAVDSQVLADADLEQALESADPNLRSLARAIVDLDGMVNELRILAPAPVVDSAVEFFGFVTDSTMDGVHDCDDFRARYTARKSAFVDAVRDAHGERRLSSR
ncbi:hypothetical protein FK531_21150 [Rhodococcus spelaei]|uniref:Uncharacterized protein n=1 Tax=Rhodococcus spelaei TaxID=2546320 RepID=A0A541AZW8_9NOCA|nr:hypothetical protein [Rhodococcus spelaei]TQF65606.1 hypothetical protein FK531_21150 [Rhodococcus spelaei]